MMQDQKMFSNSDILESVEGKYMKFAIVITFKTKSR